MDILLVDDDELLRQSLLMLLTNEGYTVSEAETGEKALELAGRHYYDLVLCDVRMPGMDGIEAIRHLKDSIADADFVVMTGYASEEAPIEALRLGVDDYLTKPFDLPVFLEKLRAIARRRRRLARATGFSLDRFIQSMRTHLPARARQCERVEEICHGAAQGLDLQEADRELLRLGCWYYPLALEPVESDEPPEVETEEPTDELARLLWETVSPGERGRLAQLLSGAANLGRGTPLPSDLDEPVRDNLEAAAREAGAEPVAVEASGARLQVRTLGRFELRFEGRLVERKEWQSASARWLVLYLLTRGGQSVPEDRLAELFWPGSPPKKAHRALVSSVHRARKALGDPSVLARYDRSYGIDRDCEYDLDTENLISAYRKGTQKVYQERPEEALQCFQEMVDLYRGDFIPECQDEWCVRLREDYRLKMVDALEKGAEILRQAGRLTEAQEWCRRALRLERTSEPAWVVLLKVLATQGHRDQVESEYRECEQILKEELKLKPGAQLREVYQQALA